MSANRPAAILFDLDNTLTSRATDVVSFAALFAEDFSEQLQPIASDELASILIEVDCGGYNPRRAEVLGERLAWRSAPTTSLLEAHWQERFADVVSPRPGMLETPDHLTAMGLKLGVVTNGFVFGQNRKIDRLGIRDRIQSLVVSEAVEAWKPDARIFEFACQQIDVAPRACWFVGDHPVKDVLASMRVGMTGVWIHDSDSGHNWPEAEPPPHLEIQTLLELTNLIE